MLSLQGVSLSGDAEGITGDRSDVENPQQDGDGGKTAAHCRTVSSFLTQSLSGLTIKRQKKLIHFKCYFLRIANSCEQAPLRRVFTHYSADSTEARRMLFCSRTKHIDAVKDLTADLCIQIPIL